MRTTPEKYEFIRADRSGDLLKRIYHLRKAETKKFSLQYICNLAKIPSKGYLSDVMSGRRHLNARYASKLAEVLGLKGIEKKIFVLLFQKDGESSPLRRAVLEKRIKSYQEQLKAGLQDVPEDISSPLLFARIFCSLGLFSRAPSREELKKVFSEENPGVIDATIDHLLKCSALTEKGGRLSVKSSRITFGQGNPQDSNIRYLVDCLEFAKSQIAIWYPRKNESYIESATLSVRKSKYLEAIPKIKEFFDVLQTELEEATGADELVQLNIQIFPDKLARC